MCASMQSTVVLGIPAPQLEISQGIMHLTLSALYCPHSPTRVSGRNCQRGQRHKK